MLISGRRAGGTQTIRRPARSALTVAAATASGVVANGAGCIPSVIFDRTQPGLTIRTARPAAGQGIAESLGEAVDASLRRAVHVVGLTHPFAGDAGQDDEVAVALPAELPGHRGADTDGPREVDVDKVGGGARVVLKLRLIA